MDLSPKPLDSIEHCSDKKEHILRSAELLFSEFGFEGVSTRALAKQAGVNIAMLSYYFGSKEKLYEATIHHLLEKRRDNLNKLLQKKSSPIEKIEAIVDYYVDKVFGQGESYKIFMREVSMSQDSSSCQEILNFFMSNMELMKKVFQEGFDNGTFRKVDAEMTIVTMIASVHHLTHTPALTRKMFHIEGNEPFLSNDIFKSRLKNHLKELLRSHLAVSHT